MVIQVKRPKAVVFDILGTASKSGFLEKILFPFLKQNLESFVDTHWNEKEFKKLYSIIVQNSLEANKNDVNSPLVVAHGEQTSKMSLMAYINYVTENGINSPPITQLRFKVWFDGYQQSVLRTPIYSDVPTKLKRWFAEGIKFYVFSNTWVNAQKALLKNTNHGDLTNLISGHYDNDFGSLNEPDSWRRLSKEIGHDPTEILFLTKSPLEARAAGDAGLGVCLVLTHRHNVKGVSSEDKRRFPYVRTLNDLEWVDTADLGGMPTPRTSMMPITTTVTQATQPIDSGAPVTSGAGGSVSAMPTNAPSSAAAQSHASGATGASSHSHVSAHSSHSQQPHSRVPSSSRASSSKAPSSQGGGGGGSQSGASPSTSGASNVSTSPSHK